MPQPNFGTLFRREKISREYGSPPADISPAAAIAAGAFTESDIETHATARALRKYGLPDTLEVINNDAVDIQINLNGTGDAGEYLIPSGVIKTITNTPIQAWRITNLDGALATTLGAIKIRIWKAARDADSAARGQ